MGKFIDMTGQTYNYWYIIDRDYEKQSKSIYWRCKCLLCGMEKSVSGIDIRSGKSTNCGCLKKQKIAERNRQKYKNIAQNQYGYLKAISPTEKRQNTYVVWKCECLNCGRIVEVCYHDLVKGATQSCGCMKESHGELAIKQLLISNNIPFETEKTFKDCRFPNTNALARFDFYVNNNYIIEFDGSQHYSPMFYNNCGWNNEENFIKTQQRDQYKNEWCKENQIPIIRIPYTKLKTLCIDDLKLETTQYKIQE